MEQESSSSEPQSSSSSSPPLLQPSIYAQLDDSHKGFWGLMKAFDSAIWNNFQNRKRDFIIDYKMRSLDDLNVNLVTYIMDEATFDRMKAQCKAKGVTVGSMLSAVLFQAICETREKQQANMLMIMLAGLRRHIHGGDAKNENASNLGFGACPMYITAELPPGGSEIDWDLATNVQNQARENMAAERLIPLVRAFGISSAAVRMSINKQLELTKRQRQQEDNTTNQEEHIKVSTFTLSNNGATPVDVSRYDPEILNVDSVLGHVNLQTGSIFYFNVNAVKTAKGTRMSIMCMYPGEAVQRATVDRLFAVVDHLLRCQSVAW